MVDVITETEIGCSIEEVSEYASNPCNAPDWYVNIKSVEWKTPPPLSIGSQLAFKANFLGRDLAYVYVIKELVPHQKLVMSTEEGPFPMETTYTWEKIDENRTKMTLRNRGYPSGLSKLMAPFMVPVMRKANKKDLALIKVILEDRHPDNQKPTYEI